MPEENDRPPLTEAHEPVTPPSPSRRSVLEYFIHILGGAVTLAMGVPVLGALIAPVIKTRGDQEWAAVGPVDQFQEGQTVRAVFQEVKQDGYMRSENPVTVYITKKGDDYQVLSAICTHLGCAVNWNEEKKQFACPCHNGWFAPDGKVLSGPPPKPLSRLQARVNSGQLEVKNV